MEHCGTTTATFLTLTASTYVEVTHPMPTALNGTRFVATTSLLIESNRNENCSHKLEERAHLNSRL